MGTDTTTNVSFAPGLLSIPQTFQDTIDLFEKEVKVKDTEYFVPGERCFYMQLSSNNKYCSRAHYYRGVLPYVSSIISRVEHDESHPCAHWNAVMNKHWRHSMYHKIGTITDYNYPIDNDKDT